MTPQESSENSYTKNYPHREDEMQLIDYLLVIWKYKWLIIGGTLICVIVALIAGIIAPKAPERHSISMVFGPAVPSIDDKGNYVQLNISDGIIDRIKDGSHNTEIFKRLNVQPVNINFEVKKNPDKGTTLLQISSQWEEKDIDLGLKVSKQLNLLFCGEVNKYVENKRDILNKQIVKNENKIKNIKADKKNQMEALKTQQQIIERRIEEVMLEKNNVKNDIETIIRQRDGLLREKGGSENQNLVYSFVIQGMYLSNQLNVQLLDLKTRKAKLDADIKTVNIEIGDMAGRKEADNLQGKYGNDAVDSVRAQIDDLTAQKAIISDMRMIQGPDVSPVPVPVKYTRKKIILLSGVVGLLFFVFLAFFIEYIKNALKTKEYTR